MPLSAVIIYIFLQICVTCWFIYLSHSLMTYHNMIHRDEKFDNKKLREEMRSNCYWAAIYIFVVGISISIKTIVETITYYIK